MVDTAAYEKQIQKDMARGDILSDADKSQVERMVQNYVGMGGATGKGLSKEKAKSAAGSPLSGMLRRPMEDLVKSSKKFMNKFPVRKRDAIKMYAGEYMNKITSSKKKKGGGKIKKNYAKGGSVRSASY
jgi:hypothetical protein